MAAPGSAGRLPRLACVAQAEAQPPQGPGRQARAGARGLAACAPAGSRPPGPASSLPILPGAAGRPAHTLAPAARSRLWLNPNHPTHPTHPPTHPHIHTRKRRPPPTISSARMPLTPLSYRWIIQLRPCSWYSRMVPPLTSDGWTCRPRRGVGVVGPRGGHRPRAELGTSRAPGPAQAPAPAPPPRTSPPRQAPAPAPRTSPPPPPPQPTCSRWPACPPSPSSSASSSASSASSRRLPRPRPLQRRGEE
jgi:hypothetical protein